MHGAYDVYNVIIIREREICASGLVRMQVCECASHCVYVYMYLYHIYDEQDKTNTIIPQRVKSGKSSCWDRRKSRVCS
jgi:hypothetical protein